MKIGIGRDVTTLSGKVIHTKKDALLTFDILPRNAPELMRRCEGLLRQARDTRKRGFFPTETTYVMTFFADPACISCIQGLYYEEQDLEATDGLKRIGTDEAFEAMISGTKSKKDAAAAAYARGILRERLPKIQNPRIPAAIIAAIR